MFQGTLLVCNGASAGITHPVSLHACCMLCMACTLSNVDPQLMSVLPGQDGSIAQEPLAEPSGSRIESVFNCVQLVEQTPGTLLRPPARPAAECRPISSRYRACWTLTELYSGADQPSIILSVPAFSSAVLRVLRRPARPGPVATACPAPPRLGSRSLQASRWGSWMLN